MWWWFGGPLRSQPPQFSRPQTCSTVAPDLNAIEPGWVLLKRQLLLEYPDAPTGVEAVLPSVWEKIPERQFESLWKPILGRVQAAIEAKGWHTRY